MINQDVLSAMAQSDINGGASGTLPDLREVRLTGGTPAERLESLLSQTKNPYCFRIDKTPVKISFSGEDDLETILKSYFLSLDPNELPAEA